MWRFVPQGSRVWWWLRPINWWAVGSMLLMVASAIGMGFVAYGVLMAVKAGLRALGVNLQ